MLIQLSEMYRVGRDCMRMKWKSWALFILASAQRVNCFIKSFGGKFYKTIEAFNIIEFPCHRINPFHANVPSPPENRLFYLLFQGV